MKRYLIAIGFVLLSSCTCFSQGDGTSVRDLIVIGLDKNIGLQVQALNVPVSKAEIVSNMAVFDPELFATAGYVDTVTPIASSLSLLDQSESDQLSGELGVRQKYRTGLLASLSLNSEWIDDNDLSESLAPRYRTALNLQLTQPLLRNFGQSVNTTHLRLALKQNEQAGLDYQLQAQSLALQIELAAAKFAGEAQIQALRGDAVVLANELYAANKRRFDAGVIPISEVQEAETALANRELNLSLAQQAKELDFESLNRQLNHALDLDFDGRSLYLFPLQLAAFELPTMEQMFSAAKKKNISLQLSEIAIQNSEIQQKYYRNQLKPQLDLTVQAGVNGLSGDERTTAISRYEGGWFDSFSSSAEADGYQWGAGLEFTLPLGNRAAKSKLKQADLQRRQANYRQRDLETELRSELQQQVINLQRAFDQVEIAQRFEKLAELSLRQEQRRLEEGLSDTFRIISFQDNMISAKIGRINALIQYYAAAAQLSFTRGTILEKHSIILAKTTEESLRDTL